MPFVRHLIIFARSPRLGTGKRRLAADIGPVQALRFQRVTLSFTLRRLGNSRRWTTWIAATPNRSGPWPIGRNNLLRQGKGDLGTRMTKSMKGLPPGPAIIIGTDIPGITARHIAQAFHLLGASDAVFGPAMDGGYWLVGLRRRPRLLSPFRHVRWSSKYALADTLENLTGRNVAFIDQMADVDDAQSLAFVPHWERFHAYPLADMVRGN